MSTPGALDFAKSVGGKIEKEEVLSAVDKYEKYHVSFGGKEEDRKANYADMVNKYYDLSTSFYEFGWGESFHFAARYEGRYLAASLEVPHWEPTHLESKMERRISSGEHQAARTLSRFTASFRTWNEVDIISAIEFDKTGDHLATGDRGGRVVLFERTDLKDHSSRRELERLDYPVSRHPEFRYKGEFQSHEPEFDYLKSLEIEEKINKIRWCQTVNGALFLLSTNDKTIKLWKVQEKKVKKICDMNIDTSFSAGNGNSTGSTASSANTYNIKLPNGGYTEKLCHMNDDFVFPVGGIPSLRLPVVVSCHETNLIPRCRRVYAHAHDYHINSISNNSDGETFISADDLRINLWNLAISSQSFNIVDMKPANMEDLTEVITSAEFHPLHCNTLAYSSSKGSIRLIDMRQSALCDKHAKLFEDHEASSSKSFFEIIASISDIKFAKDGRYILSRDYMTLKLWDINMDSGPVSTFQVHEYLRPKLCDLYENDSIFDKFECCLSGDGLRVATGSYSNLFRVFDCAAGNNEATTLEASKNPMRKQALTPNRPAGSLSSLTRASCRRGGEGPGLDANGGAYDFTTKLLHLAWHPTENSIACAAANSLYMYYA